MDPARFDALAKTLHGATRRSVGTAILGGTTIALRSLLIPDRPVGARNKKKKKKKKKRKKTSPPPSDTGCTSAGAPDSTVCATIGPACGGSYRCCSCKEDTSGQAVCSMTGVPDYMLPNGDLQTCLTNADCPGGWICLKSTSTQYCIPICT